MNKIQEKALVAFKKAQGQINKLVKMVEGDKYCIDIMQQNLAAIGLLKSANKLILENHLKTHAKEQIKSSSGEKAIEELVRIYNLSNK